MSLCRQNLLASNSTFFSELTLTPAVSSFTFNGQDLRAVSIFSSSLFLKTSDDSFQLFMSLNCTQLSHCTLLIACNHKSITKKKHFFSVFGHLLILWQRHTKIHEIECLCLETVKKKKKNRTPVVCRSAKAGGEGAREAGGSERRSPGEARKCPC